MDSPNSLNFPSIWRSIVVLMARIIIETVARMIELYAIDNNTRNIGQNRHWNRGAGGVIALSLLYNYVYLGSFY